MFQLNGIYLLGDTNMYYAKDVIAVKEFVNRYIYQNTMI